MKRTVVSVVAALGAMLALAPHASAAERTMTFRHGPIDVGPFQVEQNDADLTAPTPQMDGFITAMEVDIVDASGRSIPIQRLMLHHVVFLNLGSTIGSRRDRTCDNYTLLDSKTRVPGVGERFFASGEERVKLRMPPGYGYRIEAGDRWAILWMLMNHRAKSDRAYIQYTVTVDDDPSLKPADPYWLDVRNCRSDPVYDVPGGRRAGSTHSRGYNFRSPVNGRIVAGAGHLHGGGRRIDLQQPGCGRRTLYSSRPTYGHPGHPFYRVTPVLHEPGPIDMSAFATAQGFPVVKGQTLRITSRYDASRVHTRVMGIFVVFIAEDDSITDGCGPRPTDLAESQAPPGRAHPPRFTVPIIGFDRRGRARPIRRPPGRTARRGRRAGVRVENFSFGPANLSVKRGARVSWRFFDQDLHNVTVANGPRGFSSVHLNGRRSYARRLTRPGTYRLMCSLHPVSMTQTVRVRRR